MYSVDQLATSRLSMVGGVDIGNLYSQERGREGTSTNQIIPVTTQEVISSRNSILAR